jgi:hypothetical protein
MANEASAPTPDDGPLHVHGVQEEYFYMMVHPCACGGPWLSQSQEVEEDGDKVRHHVSAACFKCGQERTFHFQLDERPGPKDPIRAINPTEEPSRALDLAEWLELTQFYLGRIERLDANVEKAQSLLDARQCLEEARKFFGPQDEAPPASALWSEKSRQAAASQPEAFRRSTIDGMLERLPPLERLRQADSLDQKTFKQAVRERARQRVGRKWWQFWKLFRRS